MASIEEQMGYSPSFAVLTAHSIPRFTMTGSSASNTFSPDTSYGESIAILPVAIMVIGFFSLFIYHCICCCFCCNCFSCVDSINDEIKEIEEDRANKIACKRRTAIAFFAILFCALIACNQMFSYGNNTVTNGVKDVRDLLDYIIWVLSGLNTAGNSLDATGNQIIVLLRGAKDYGHCSLAGNAISTVKEITTYANEVGGIAGGFTSTVSGWRDTFNHYGMDRRDHYVFILYILGYAIIFLYLMGYMCRSKINFRFVIAFSGLLVFALTIAGCIQMIIVVCTLCYLVCLLYCIPI